MEKYHRFVKKIEYFQNYRKLANNLANGLVWIHVSGEQQNIIKTWNKSLNSAGDWLNFNWFSWIITNFDRKYYKL